MNNNTPALTPELLQRMDAYWRAANYLSVGQIYLYDNPLAQAAAETLGREAAGGRTLGVRRRARISSTYT
jgi:phosphoketolase